MRRARKTGAVHVLGAAVLGLLLSALHPGEVGAIPADPEPIGGGIVEQGDPIDEPDLRLPLAATSSLDPARDTSIRSPHPEDSRIRGREDLIRLYRLYLALVGFSSGFYR